MFEALQHALGYLRVNVNSECVRHLQNDDTGDHTFSFVILRQACAAEGSRKRLTTEVAFSIRVQQSPGRRIALLMVQVDGPTSFWGVTRSFACAKRLPSERHGKCGPRKIGFAIDLDRGGSRTARSDVAIAEIFAIAPSLRVVHERPLRGRRSMV